MKNYYEGLIAATFSPMKKDGSINTNIIPAIVEHLIADGVKGLYICGSTGEGPLLSTTERKEIAHAYITAAKGKLPCIVQVGHDSLTEARELAAHAQHSDADAIAAIPPTYFKCNSVDNLVSCMAQIAASAPKIPFYYYHVPALTGGSFDMIEFLDKGANQIPNLAGIKYSNITVHEFQDCLNYNNGQFDILFGCDEMLLSGLATGARGAVGSTFNFAGPLYNKIIKSFQAGDMEKARHYQLLSVRMIRMLYGFRGQPAFKSIMKLIGLDCGPNRLPLQSLDDNEIENMKLKLEETDFFNWARN